MGQTAHTRSELISPNAVNSPHSGDHIVEMLTFEDGALASHLYRIHFQQAFYLGVADPTLAVPGPVPTTTWNSFV